MKEKFLNNKRFNKNEQTAHKKMAPKLRNCRTKANQKPRRNVKGKSKQRLDNDAKLDPKEIQWQTVDCTHIHQNGHHWQATVKAVINILVQ